MRNDPLTQGPKLFGRHCASCHDYRPPVGDGYTGPVFATLQAPQIDEKGQVVRKDGQVVYDNAATGAPNLYGFGTRRWIERLLDHENWKRLEYGEPKPSDNPRIAADPEHPDNHKRPVIADYFGNTAHKTGDMADYLAGDGEALLQESTSEGRKPTAAHRKIAAALAAQAVRPMQPGDPKPDNQAIAEGIELIQQNCIDCHRFGADGDLGGAPDLTGYGSYEWMMGLVSDPTHPRFYRDDNDRMPSFAKDLEHPEKNNVSARELSLIVDWIRGDYYRDEEQHRRLSHDEETARRTVGASRQLELSKPQVVRGEESQR